MFHEATMHIAAVCVTYLRPRQLGWMIQCFLRQDYPPAQRELLILDDAGQYGDRQGEGWRLVSQPERFASLGEKRNAAVALVSKRAEALAVWDDDDLYLPWALRASAALAEADWSRPSLVLHPQADGSFHQHQTGGLFHGGRAYRRKALERAGGYPPINNGEDQGLAQRFQELGVRQADPCAGLAALLRLLLGRRYVASVRPGRPRLPATGPHGEREKRFVHQRSAGRRLGAAADCGGNPSAAFLKEFPSPPGGKGLARIIHKLVGWVKQTVILVGLRSLIKRSSSDEAWNNHLSVCEPHHDHARP